MSRALDKDVKEALKNGDHRAVFVDISGALTDTSAGLLEIEMLGMSHVFDPNTTLLQDGNAIAIPKLRLVQAFIVARQILIAHAEGNHGGSTDEILRATAVILMMDPEYLTAANTRKRLLQRKLHDGDDTSTSLKTEKHFVDSLLTSRLHRHTKSPTLWNHRRWLMDQFTRQGLDVTAEDDIKKVITVSGERHPRNYYAWCHARYLINAVITQSPECEESLSRTITVVKEWSFGHHNDISGWQFLLFLLQKQQQETQPVFRKTLQLAESFKWRNESVWYFLRYLFAASDRLADEDRDEFTRVRTALWETAAEDSQERRMLDAVQEWLACQR
ncbi:hypothetical protein B0J13DRAFT_620215 [Dactylonectria estremocensis]|uniref:Protein prenyltransferase n=1 Tax=Dactylonectria estremocensis TaxID=1079267 RepID=A0A9P9F0I3_9HYPO|nr:hypothetical protein B0J13DRAFT_620215 [Dactylonectria estremocensis]